MAVYHQRYACVFQLLINDIFICFILHLKWNIFRNSTPYLKQLSDSPPQLYMNVTREKYPFLWQPIIKQWFLTWSKVLITMLNSSLVDHSPTMREVPRSNPGQGDLQRKFIFLPSALTKPSKCVGWVVHSLSLSTSDQLEKQCFSGNRPFSW